MDKLLTKRIRAIITALVIISTTAFSQFDNVDFLRAGATDGLKIVEAYISPWVNAFGAGLTGGWYNTAKPHQLGGFDITVGLSAGFVPSSATTFDVSKIGLTSLTGTGIASTVAGPETDGPVLTASQGGVTLAAFQTPPGTDWKIIPAPTAQVGIGLPLGTELKVRFMPKITISDGSLSLWGIGLVHSIMQYLPGDKLLPIDVSLFGGYTKLKANVPLELEPENYDNYSTYTMASFQDQKMTANVTAMNIGVIGSLNLPVLTVYGGLGYSKTNTEVKLLGNFPLPTVNLAISTTEGVYEDAGVLNNFPSMEFKNFSGVRANIGLRVKLSVITIHVDYTRAQYNVLTAGFGVSFR